MLTLDEACEIASCHFGERIGTSCIEQAWSARECFFFKPAADSAFPHVAPRAVSVDKRNGLLRECLIGWGKDVTEKVPLSYRT